MTTTINPNDIGVLVSKLRTYFPEAYGRMHDDFSAEATLALLEFKDFNQALSAAAKRINASRPGKIIAPISCRPRLATCRSLVELCDLYELGPYSEDQLRQALAQQPRRRQEIVRALISGEKPVSIGRRYGLPVSNVAKEVRYAVTRMVVLIEGLPRQWRSNRRRSR